jgi:hypothetical protein
MRKFLWLLAVVLLSSLAVNAKAPEGPKGCFVSDEEMLQLFAKQREEMAGATLISINLGVDEFWAKWQKPDPDGKKRIVEYRLYFNRADCDDKTSVYRYGYRDFWQMYNPIP